MANQLKIKLNGQIIEEAGDLTRVYNDFFIKKVTDYDDEMKAKMKNDPYLKLREKMRDR